MTHAHSMVSPVIPRTQAYRSEYRTWREYASFRPNTSVWPLCVEMLLGRFFAHAYEDGSWRCGLAGTSFVAVGDCGSQEQAVVAAEARLRQMIGGA